MCRLGLGLGLARVQRAQPLHSPTAHVCSQVAKERTATASAFDSPPEDIFSSNKGKVEDDIFGSSVKQPLRKPEKSLDELLASKGQEEVDRGGKVRRGGGGGGEVRRGGEEVGG